LIPPFSQHTSKLLLKSFESTPDTGNEKSFVGRSHLDNSEERSFLNPDSDHVPNADGAGLSLPVLFRDANNHLCEVEADIGKFTECQLDVSRLNEIHKYLWLAGRPMSARPLHRQNMMGREVVIIEQTDLHLTWIGRRLFVKPLPVFIFSYWYWKKYLCPSEELHSRAMGLLLSYVWLVCQPSDLKVAIDCGLLPSPLVWQQWVILVGDLVRTIDMTGLSNVNKRYTYGELRLSRLNKIYRFAPEFELKHIIRGYQSQDTVYRTLFERHFAWVLTLFVYVTVLLSSVQVGLATDRLQNSMAFQRISFGLAILFILLPVVFFVSLLIWYLILFSFHLRVTLRFQKSQKVEREAFKGGESHSSV